MSRTVKDLTAGAGLAFVDRGEQTLKGIPEPWELYVVARTHAEQEWRTLRGAGADVAIWGERELAIDIVAETLRRYGVSPQEIAAITRGLRRL